MKDLKDIITEKLRLDNSIKPQYTCHPQTRDELKYILKERLAKDKNADLNDIDVSQIIDMTSLFYLLDPHNIKINEWDVSNVENMRGMFYLCKHFNSDISKWNVSNVKDMTIMFYICDNFNCNLNNWDVSKVKYMDYIFYNCKSLKKKPAWYKK